MVFNLTLRALAGNQLLKKQIGKMIQIKKKKKLCERNPKTKCFTFRQHHRLGFI